MRSAVLFLLVGVCFVLLGLSTSPAIGQVQTPNPDQWRYTFYNGEWWYWLPQDRWVYWRANRWNDYNPQTFHPNNGSTSAPCTYVGSTYGNQTLPESDIRPFYGHSLSQWGDGYSGQDEIGPFYGHAMPGEVFGPRISRGSSIRPFYGHAAATYGY
jgi:hypothetical protein